MSLKFFSSIFISLFLLLCLQPLSASDKTSQQAQEKNNKQGDIVISIPDIPEGSQGFIVKIFRHKDTFLKEAQQEFYFEREALKGQQLRLDNIEYGDIALSLSADLNGDRKLDTKIFGIPAEPVGFVNNPKPRFGPPRFKDCLFQFNKNELEVEILLKSL